MPVYFKKDVFLKDPHSYATCNTSCQDPFPGMQIKLWLSLTDWFQIGKGVPQGCILAPCLFNLYAEYIMRNAGLKEAQAGIRLPGEISITSDMQMIPPLWQKVKRNSKASW